MSTTIADINAEVPIENGNFEKSIFLREIDFGKWLNVFVHVSTPLGASRFSLEVGEQHILMSKSALVDRTDHSFIIFLLIQD